MSKSNYYIQDNSDIETKKLAHAVRLLSEGKTVSYASAESGFADCSHFIVLFKRKFGKTPLQFKRSAVEHK